MAALPLAKEQKESFDNHLHRMGERSILLSRQCQTLGNMLAQFDNDSDFEKIGMEYETVHLDDIPPLPAAHYLSILLMDRVGALTTPLQTMLDDVSESLKTGASPEPELAEAVLESMKPENMCKHFRGAPSHLAFIPEDKLHSYSWPDMLDMLSEKIKSSGLGGGEKEALLHTVDTIGQQLFGLLAQERTLSHIIYRLLPPPEKIYER